MWDECVVVVAEPKELLNLPLGHQSGPLCNRLDLLWVHPHLTLGHYVSQVLDLAQAHVALTPFGIEFMRTQLA